MAEISHFPVPALFEMPSDIRKRIDEIHEKAGFIPNVFIAFARRPDEFRAFFDYHDILMEKDGALTKVEREMIVVATSALNQCLYCVIAHGAILRVRADDPLIADQIATNYRKADITPRQRAMLDFAVNVAQSAETLEPRDLDQLSAQGLGQEEAWDIAAIASFFGMSNRMANFMCLQPNVEFFAMGRAQGGC
ncbi:peroxidase-related enzyme [Roseovarius sp. 217]|uniref:peroxidase-related enzyme n=1 Tax=Roseovarius sp. (strain 217) TaxID=314264 RepID=UPI0000685945|nr:peroxidase-related enzyme [Roseovarius sp. 217]EAQ26821.1 Alkylhydroperoxidase AhpD core protein [Roseovarius sp. 217]